MKRFWTLFFIVVFNTIPLQAAEDCQRDFSISKPEDIGQLPPGVSMWTGYKCEACGDLTSALPLAGNRSASLKCNNCGKPREDESFSSPKEWMALGQKVEIATSHNIEKALSGPVMVCSSCGTSMFRDAEQCPDCGAPAIAVNDSQDQANTLDRPKNNETKLNNKYLKRWAAGAILVASSVLAVVGYGTRTYTVEGQVADANFIHTSIVERFTQSTSKGWKNELREHNPVMPSDGLGEEAGIFNIRNPRQEIHHFDNVISRYDTEYYTELVSETTYSTQLRDNGNGSFTTESVPSTSYRSEQRSRQVPVYEQVPRFETMVDYDTFVWLEKIRKSIEGKLPKNDNEPLPWPELPLGELDRLLREPNYKISVSYVQGSKKYSYQIQAKTENEFRKWQPGEKVAVVKNNFGTVLEVKLISEEH